MLRIGWGHPSASETKAQVRQGWSQRPLVVTGLCGVALLCFLLLVDQCADRLSLHVHCPGCSMKRASSLNVLNVGGKAAEDHFQVRSPAPQCPQPPGPGQAACTPAVLAGPCQH